MISKINNIKNLGLVFQNYQWDSSLPEFKKVNIIYGWNGSGKTTLSRLFNTMDGKISPDYTYEIVCDGSEHSHDNPILRKVRVFNEDYVKENVIFEKGLTSKLTLVLGEENNQLLEQISQDRKTINGSDKNIGLKKQIQGLEKELKSEETKLSVIFSNVAKLIGAAVGMNALRNYRKPDAERDFKAISDRTAISVEEMEVIRKRLLNPPNATIDIITLPELRINQQYVTLSDTLSQLNTDAESALSTLVAIKVIQRFSENADLSEWVELGMHLHNTYKSEKCEYCGGTISEERKNEIEQHFNKEDQLLRSKLEEILNVSREIYKAVQFILPTEKKIDSQYEHKQQTIIQSLQDEKTMFLTELSEFVNKVKEKIANRGVKITYSNKLDISKLIDHVNDLNSIYTDHNKIVANYEEVKAKSVEQVKAHYFADIATEVQDLELEIGEKQTAIWHLRNQLGEVQKRIDSNLGKISSDSIACELLNDKLSVFLGHSELKFNPVYEKNADGTENTDKVQGYTIERNGKSVKNLSEGEKTAIALIFFIVHLSDHTSNTTQDIVVIDDPISSLDSNSLYQAFSFLKNTLKDCYQVFFLTHNFDFLKLLLNWRKYDGDRQTRYYMIKPKISLKKRIAIITKMDKELHEYRSEYHYLFKILKDFNQQQDGSIAMAYPIPNIARKVWETFLHYCIPNGKNPHAKCGELIEEGFDSNKINAIYDFTNDNSHIYLNGFNPSLVQEAIKVTNEIFEMMEVIAPRHYRKLQEAIS